VWLVTVDRLWHRGIVRWRAKAKVWQHEALAANRNKLLKGMFLLTTIPISTHWHSPVSQGPSKCTRMQR
jgi:hypothetical protein